MLAEIKKLIYRFAGVDESGTLGLSILTSKYFILSCFLHDDVNFDKKFRKFIGKLNHKKNKKKINTLHARSDDDKTKLKLIKFLTQFNYRFVVHIFKKNLSGNGELDYVELLRRLVENTEKEYSVENIFVSSPKLKQSFQDSIMQISNKIELSTPRRTPVLQVADLGAWAVFRKFEFGDEIYFKILQDRIELVEIKI
jgi:hypothetical protein